MTEVILYSFRRCPYAMRARMALSVSGANYEHREVVLRDKPPEMLEVSPKGTVPVLVVPGAPPLEESLDIMHWALGQNDPEGWLDRNDQLLIETNDGPFKHHLDRYKYATRYDDVDPEEHRAAALSSSNSTRGWQVPPIYAELGAAWQTSRSFPSSVSLQMPTVLGSTRWTCPLSKSGWKDSSSQTFSPG